MTAVTRWSVSREKRDTHSLGFESVDSLKLGLNVVSDRLELGEDLLSLANDILVPEHLVVVGKVDVGFLLLELGELTLGVISTLAESRNLSKGVLAKTQVGDLGQIHCSSTSSHCDVVGEGAGEEITVSVVVAGEGLR